MEPALSPTAAEPFRPIFIVGCERSGTTLLAVLLDRHSQLAITPETHYFLRMLPSPSHSHPPGVTTHEQFIERLFTNNRIPDLALDRDQLAACFQKSPPSAPTLFQAILEQYSGMHHKPRVGEKTPFHLWFVPRIIEWFPHARILGIVRDGRDVVRSVLQAPWTSDRRLRPHCLTWIHGVRAATRFADRFPEQFRIVRYEDLLLAPEKTLRALDDFLNLPFEPTQLATQQQEHTDVVPTWENDWKGKALQPLDPSRIGDWKRHVTDHERLILNSMMKKELRQFGYEDTELPKTPLPTRVWNHFLNTLCKARLYRLWDRVAHK